jgi:hypothetical protein
MNKGKILGGIGIVILVALLFSYLYDIQALFSNGLNIHTISAIPAIIFILYVIYLNLKLNLIFYKSDNKEFEKNRQYRLKIISELSPTYIMNLHPLNLLRFYFIGYVFWLSSLRFGVIETTLILILAIFMWLFSLTAGNKTAEAQVQYETNREEYEKTNFIAKLKWWQFLLIILFMIFVLPLIILIFIDLLILDMF